MTENTSEQDIENKIELVLRQTDYTRETAIDKLQENNYDHLKVIRGYLGVTEKKALTGVSSVNQEIYKQLRYRLDNSMRDYTKRVENGEAKKII
jgi:hypothetical protein